MYKCYTGVGSRSVPSNIIEDIKEIAKYLSKQGWTLRSGGALGCDKAFEYSAEQKEIFYANDVTQAAMNIAKQYHPAWDRCSEFAKKLHGRNAFQVLGRTLKTPSKFLICWTPDGCRTHQDRTIKTGGTGTAISIADNYKVKVFNLNNKEDYQTIINKIRE